MTVWFILSIALVCSLQAEGDVCAQGVDDDLMNLVLLGSPGGGKSTLGNRLVTPLDAEHRATHFPESEEVDPKTTETSSCITHWLDKAVAVTDTPGLQASGVVDEVFLKGIVESIKSLDKIAAVLLVFDMNSPRFVESEKALVRLLATMVKGGNFWDNFALVFTKTYSSVFNEEKMSVRRTNFTARMHQLIAETGVEHNKAMQTFFVDSADMTPMSRTRNELVHLRQWVLSRTPLSTREIQKPNTEFQFLEQETREREIHRKTEPIYGTKKVWDGWLMGNVFGRKKVVEAVVGHRVIVTLVDETRTKQIRYNGDVSYTDWAIVKEWTKTL